MKRLGLLMFCLASIRCGGSRDAGILTLTPAQSSLSAGGKQAFLARGSAGPWTWTLFPAELGTLEFEGDAATYTAPSVLTANQLVQVTVDSGGQTVSAHIALMKDSARADAGVVEVGTLSVVITAPEAGEVPSVRVTGPGEPRVLTHTTSFLTPAGLYDISANFVTSPDPIVGFGFAANVSSSAAQISARTPIEVGVDYQRVPGTGHFWVPRATAGVIDGYSSRDLDGGSAGPSVSLSLLMADGGIAKGPEALAFDRAGNLWVAIGDEGATPSALMMVATQALNDGGSVSPAVTILSTDVNVADAGTIASLDFPTSLAFDSSGNLWVGTCGNTGSVSMYSAPSLGHSGPVSPTIFWQGSALRCVTYLQFDPSGNLWVATCPSTATSGAVQVFGLSKLGSATLPSATASLFTDGTTFVCPSALGFTPSGNAWVASLKNPRGLVSLSYEADAGTLQAGTQVTGVNDGGTQVFAWPSSLSFDNSGTAWVLDYSQKRLQSFDSAQLSASGEVQPKLSLPIDGLDFAQTAFDPPPRGAGLYP